MESLNRDALKLGHNELVCFAHLPSTTSKAYKRNNHVKLTNPKLTMIRRVGNIRKARSHYKFTNYINGIVHTKKLH